MPAIISDGNLEKNHYSQIWIRSCPKEKHSIMIWLFLKIYVTFVFNSSLSLRNHQIFNLADGNFLSLSSNFPVLRLILELVPFFSEIMGWVVLSFKEIRDIFLTDF